MQISGHNVIRRAFAVRFAEVPASPILRASHNLVAWVFFLTAKGMGLSKALGMNCKRIKAMKFGGTDFPTSFDTCLAFLLSTVSRLELLTALEHTIFLEALSRSTA